MKRLEDIITNILETNEAARDNDFILINAVYKAMGIPVHYLTFEEICKQNVYLGLTSFESITRARRKVQSDNPYLRGNEQIKKELEAAYREYYAN